VLGWIGGVKERRELGRTSDRPTDKQPWESRTPGSFRATQNPDEICVLHSQYQHMMGERSLVRLRHDEGSAASFSE
jgi:hypothetical protein